MLQLFSTSSRNNNATLTKVQKMHQNSISAYLNGQNVILILLLLAGFALRFYRLGDLNLWCDEDITALAVKGILQNGYPELPSGAIYFRSILTIYLSALSAALFGFHEVALRVPSIVFSLGTGLVLFYLGRKIFSVQVGIVAAVIHTFSFWDVEFARHARMYEAFAFFFTFAIYAIYRGVVDYEKRWLRWSIVVSLSTIFVHILGVVLAFIYMALAMSLPVRRIRAAQLYGIAASLIIVATGYFFLIKYGFSIPVVAARSSYEQIFIPFMKSVYQTPVYGFQNHILTTAFFLLFSMVAIKYLRKRGLSWNSWAWAILICTFLLLIMQQGLAAIILLCLLLVFYRNGENTIIPPLARASIIFIVIVICIQILLTMRQLSIENSTGKDLIQRLWLAAKMITGFPKLYYFGFLTAFPAMTIIATIGLFILYKRNKHCQNMQKPLFVATVFVLPLLANGFIAGRFIEYRVNFYLNPLFILLFAFAIFECGRYFNANLKKKIMIRNRRILVLAIYGCLVLWACEQAHPNRLQEIISRVYGAKIDRSTAPGSHLRIMPDHFSTGEFIKQNRVPGDVVVVTDWLAQSHYTGEIDYWLRANAYAHQAFFSDHKYYDIYTGTQIITNLENLKALLADSREKRVWLIISLPFENIGLHLSGDIIDFLRAKKQNVVFRGRDGVSEVYLFAGVCSSDQSFGLPIVLINNH